MLKPYNPIQPASKGLGDTVAKAIHFVGLAPAKPCNACQKRQETLNKLVPYGKKGAK